MTSQKKIIFGLLLCLLLIGKVQPQEDCGEDGAAYILPNPMVNTTLTVFSQNPSLMNNVMVLSNQIASAMVSADQESTLLSSIMGPFAQILSGFGFGNQNSIDEIVNLFVTFSELIGQEVEMAEVQSQMSNYVANLNSGYSDLETIAALNDLEDLYSALYPILIDVNEAYSSFQNPVFSQYAYYTMQPLFMNAVIHISVFSMLSAASAGLGYSYDSKIWEANATSYYNSYVTLLQQYSTNAINYRLRFITLPDDSEAGMYSFQDNFLSGNPVVYEGCPAFVNAVFDDYTQAVSSGTSDFFNSLVTSFHNSSVASLVPSTQDEESSSLLRLFE